MPEMPEDRPQLDASPFVRGVPSDSEIGARLQGRTEAMRRDHEGQGVDIDITVAREHRKQANLRARLHDLGIDKMRQQQCFVHAGARSDDDTATLPWSVLYDLFSTERGVLTRVDNQDGHWHEGTTYHNRLGAEG